MKKAFLFLIGCLAVLLFSAIPACAQWQWIWDIEFPTYDFLSEQISVDYMRGRWMEPLIVQSVWISSEAMDNCKRIIWVDDSYKVYAEGFVFYDQTENFTVFKDYLSATIDSGCLYDKAVYGSADAAGDYRIKETLIGMLQIGVDYPIAVYNTWNEYVSCYLAKVPALRDNAGDYLYVCKYN